MNLLENIIEIVLPYIISVLEIMGIFIVAWSCIYAFWKYLQNTFFRKKVAQQFHLVDGLAKGLEFKMAAEILKTVLIKQLSELLVLAAVILLRALLSFLIHFKKKHTKDDI